MYKSYHWEVRKIIYIYIYVYIHMNTISMFMVKISMPGIEHDINKQLKFLIHPYIKIMIIRLNSLFIYVVAQCNNNDNIFIELFNNN
jgi:hypothetical protein